MELRLPGQQPEEPQINKWTAVTTRDPEHSRRYAQRWWDLAASGQDIDGEARLIDAMANRGARIFDVGCGTGRTGGYLAVRGHEVFGVDLDPYLIGVAREDHPAASWHVGDIENFFDSLDDDAQDEMDQLGPFELAVSAGNVMGFLSPAGRESALRAIHDVLVDGGRAVIGFGAGRGWDFDDFLATAVRVGFTRQAEYSSWQLDPFIPASKASSPQEASNFLVAVLSR